MSDVCEPPDTHVVAGRGRWRRVLAQMGVDCPLPNSAAVARVWVLHAWVRTG